jgi:uncharacterized protein YndB with AHSA1/START domain
MTTDTSTTVQATTTVELPIDEAFTLFTEGIDTWWNRDHHLLEHSRMVFEPRVGGNIYEAADDGRECRWSRVLAYDPPARVVFSWDIDPHWKIETDPARCSEVHVEFTEDEPGRTTVVLEHRHLDRHGDDWQSLVAPITSGWQQGGLDLYAAAAASR